MAVSIPRESREYIWWEVNVTRGDISGATVEAALFPDPLTRPQEVDWVTATLVGPGDPMGVAGKYYIRLLIGASGAEWNHAGEGDYQSWVRITSSPEIVVRRPGVVTVT